MCCYLRRPDFPIWPFLCSTGGITKNHLSVDLKVADEKQSLLWAAPDHHNQALTGSSSCGVKLRTVQSVFIWSESRLHLNDFDLSH